ncbi:FAD-dependent oxidoreductase [Prosthecobacter sp.]|uniref:FAD-dependent oxidoreductase n=1 Tax=Prosthecobacter sp. TaxID=1965333 RepID=UPI0037847E27
MRSIVLFVFCCLPSFAAELTTVDVCIYGGTSGGVIAAVEAARLGKKTVLIESTQRLGGMSSGGLGMTDNGSTETIGGLSREFYQRVYQFYRKPENWRFQKREDYLSWLPKIWGVDGPRMEEIQAQFLFEPRAAKAVYDDMVREAGAQVVFGERLDLKNGVVKDGAKIKTIRMESGREFAAKVFIDASYEGDLMAKAGVKYIVGREANAQYGETLNGTFPFTPAPFPKISPYVVPGDPTSGLLPRVEPKPPAPKGSADHRVQAYNFRVCLTDIEDNRVPIEKPASYNPLDYELLARHIANMKNVKPGPRKHAAVGLRGNGGDLGINFELVPNRKTDSNCGSEFGTDMFGASYGWPEGDYATRDKLFQLHKDYTLGLLWFLGHDERLPAEVRTEMQRWGLPKDDFADTGHFPHQLYVREARRMISDYVITEHDAKGGPRAEDGVALASYPLDSHGVTLYVDEAGLLHRERGFYVGGFSAFPISYRSLRPKAGECSNLLVVSCLSSSHAAYGSVRMEPVFMMVGHAAGAAASIAVDQNLTVQDVPYSALRERLVAEKQILEGKARPPVSESKPAASMPPNEQIIADVKTLADKKIVESGDYWLSHAQKGQSCDGAQVASLLLKMAKNFDSSVQGTDDALKVLMAHKVLASPTYWNERATPGRTCGGDNVRAIIRNFARLASK